MRVAYVCLDPGIPVFGEKGCSLHVQEILRAFLARGDSVTLFSVRLDDPPPEDLSSIQVVPLTIRSPRDAADREVALCEVNEKLVEVLVSESRFDLIYERHALWSYGAMEFARQQNVPSILEVNAPLVEEQATHRELVDRDTASAVASRSLSAARLVACVSDEVTAYALELGAAPERVRVIPNGVSPDRFAPRVSSADASVCFRIGFVGSLRPWHAVEDLMQATALLIHGDQNTNYELTIVGNGPQLPLLIALRESFPNEAQASIHFVGAVRPETIPNCLLKFDVAVAPYHAGGACYFSPLKLYEYMTAGLPIVAADAGQMRKLIVPKQSGLLYTPGAVLDLASKLAWVRNHPVEARKMGAQAREVILAEHTWEHRLDAMLSTLGIASSVALVS